MHAGPELHSWNGGLIGLITTSSAVRGSKPQPPEAKLTPVRRSKSLSSVPRYAGKYSLMPSRLAASERRQGFDQWHALIGMSCACAARVRTEDVAGDPAVAEPAGGVVAGEVLAVGREVAADQRGEGVVVARVHDGVPEHEQRRGPRLVRRRRRRSIGGAADAADKHRRRDRGQERPRHRSLARHAGAKLSACLNSDACCSCCRRCKYNSRETEVGETLWSWLV